MAREIGGSNRRRGRRTMPATRKATLPEMAKEYMKLGLSKKKRETSKLTGRANAITRGQGKKVGLHKTTATQLAKRDAVPVKPVVKRSAGSNSADVLRKLRSMK
mgnify:CR=1 FL=1